MDDEAADLIEELQTRIDGGEIQVVAIRESRTVDMVIRRPRSAPAHRGPREPEPCAHVWLFEPGNFQRRRCARSGCNARQVWRWLPDDTRRQGEWVNAPADVAGPEPEGARSKLKRTAKPKHWPKRGTERRKK